MLKNEIIKEAIKHYYRGRVFESTGEIELAIKEYKKAIEYGANYADVHNALGRVLAKNGYLNEAIIEFETALRLNPEYLEAKENLNKLLIKNNTLQQNQKESEQKLATEQKNYWHFQKLKKFFLKHTIFILISTTIISSLIGYKKIFDVRKQNTKQIFNTQQESISSITKFKNNLVLSCWLKKEIFFYKITKNKINLINVIEFNENSIVPTSICFINNYLYILDGWSKKIHKFLYKTNKPIFLKTIDLLKESNPLSIISYKNFIVLLNTDQELTIYDKDFKEIETINIKIKDIINISSYKNKIWLLDKNGIFYEVKNYSEIINFYKLDFFSDKTISSFLIDDKYIWLSEEGNKDLYCFSRKEFMK